MSHELVYDPNDEELPYAIWGCNRETGWIDVIVALVDGNKDAWDDYARRLHDAKREEQPDAS